jgi:class 3 adenylate cyclase
VAGEAFAQGEAARLEELRLTALETRMEAELALGLHADLVAELEALVGRHPLREGLRGQLMLALYRSGRQADALETYRQGRALLVDELGLEPGEGLRRLEAAILRQDASLAPEVAEPARGVEPAPPRLEGGKRKIVTVLFADVVDSTSLVAGQDPEQARALLDRLFDAVADEIEAAGGTVEKFIGDAVMAVFGAPVAQEDHAERALHAALALVRLVSARFAGSISLGLGIASGEVVVGRAREGGSFATGAVVNVCARLEQAAAAGEILVHSRAAHAVRGAFEFGPSRVVDAKGFPEGIECRPLVRALALTRRRRVGGREAVFVDRDRELDLLRAAYRRAAGDGRPSLVTVVGDAGVGKSALVRRFWDWLPSEQPEPLRRTGQCLSYGRAVTYRPLGDVVREELGLLATDPPELVRERLAGREILGLTLGLDVTADVHPLAARDELHEAVVRFADQLVRTRPAVVLVEDLHWGEEPLFDALERVVREVTGPLMLVVTARPELHAVRPGWGTGSRDAVTIGLEPLPGADAEVLVDELAGGALSAALCQRLVERSEGNPLFLEELLDALIDQGLLQRDGSAAVSGSDELAVPDSLRGVLAARIDLLPAAEKEALQAAAVIGRTFWRGALRELIDGTPPDLAVLEQRDFVRRRSTSLIAGERELIFKHALTREVAYAGIPKARRARLHAAFADWLERVSGGRDGKASPLAHHYAEAVRPDDAELAWAGEPERLAVLRTKALEWLRRAADLAVRRYEIEEGLALYRRALELETSVEGERELWRALGHACALGFDGHGFWTAMKRAIELADDDAVRGELYAELAYLTCSRVGMWRQRPTTEVVDGWIARGVELAEPDSAARAKALIASAWWNPTGDNEAARVTSLIAEKLDDPELRRAAWDARGIAAFAAGEYELGRAWAERCFELVDQISDPDVACEVYAAPISGCIWGGQFREARRLACVHDEIARALTSHHRMHAAAILHEVEELLGGWDTIVATSEGVEAAVEANADTPCVRNARALLVCASAHAYAGDDSEARRLEDRAEELGMEGYAQVIDTPRLRLALARGDLARAEELLARAPTDRGWYRGWLSLVSLVTRLDGLAAIGDRDRVEEIAPKHLRPGKYPEPFALRALGVVREDASLVERAAERFESLSLAWHAAETRRLLAR